MNAWTKFIDLGLSLGVALKFATSVAKRLKLKVRQVWGLILTIEVTQEKLVGGTFLPPILNRIKDEIKSIFHQF